MSAAEDRVPPQSLDAEMALIGACMVDRQIAEAVLPLVDPEDFYAHVHEAIFAAVRSLVREGQPVDKVTVAERLSRRGPAELERVGGMPYLSALMDTVQSAGSAQYYARIVREKATLRGLIRCGREILELGFSSEHDVNGALATASERLRRIVETGSPQLGRSMFQVRQRYLDAMSAKRLAYYTPWEKLDRLTGGFTSGEFVAWAADPGFGKSMALTMLAAFIAERYGHVAFYTTEMGDVKTYARFLALFSGVSARRQRDPAITDFERDRLVEAQQVVDSLPITMFDASPALTSDEVAAQCRRLHRTEELAAFVIDTVGKLDDIEGPRGAPRASLHERQQTAINTLIRTAQELGCVAHGVFHFTRPQDGKGSPQPHMSRIRNGGNVEGTATTIIFPHHAGPHDDLFIVDKARDGSRGTVKMTFHGDRALWLQRDHRVPWFQPPPPEQVEAGLEDQDEMFERGALA